jgi:hypothetical protein
MVTWSKIFTSYHFCDSTNIIFLPVGKRQFSFPQGIEVQILNGISIGSPISGNIEELLLYYKNDTAVSGQYIMGHM